MWYVCVCVPAVTLARPAWLSKLPPDSFHMRASSTTWLGAAARPRQSCSGLGVRRVTDWAMVLGAPTGLQPAPGPDLERRTPPPPVGQPAIPAPAAPPGQPRATNVHPRTGRTASTDELWGIIVKTSLSALDIRWHCSAVSRRGSCAAAPPQNTISRATPRREMAVLRCPLFLLWAAPSSTTPFHWPFVSPRFFPGATCSRTCCTHPDCVALGMPGLRPRAPVLCPADHPVE